MVSKEKIDRINQLARKSKDGGLNEAERKEQRLLREEYLANFRKNFKQQLDCIEFTEDDDKSKIDETVPIKI